MARDFVSRSRAVASPPPASPYPPLPRTQGRGTHCIGRADSFKAWATRLKTPPPRHRTPGTPNRPHHRAGIATLSGSESAAESASESAANRTWIRAGIGSSSAPESGNRITGRIGIRKHCAEGLVFPRQQPESLSVDTSRVPRSSLEIWLRTSAPGGSSRPGHSGQPHLRRCSIATDSARSFT